MNRSHSDRTSGHTTSLWLATASQPLVSDLMGNETADVCVVGGGIAGLTTAYLLQRRGQSVVLLEDGLIGSGESARTTGHLSNALDDRYHMLEQWHGTESARLAAESHTAAIDQIEQIVRDEAIDCDFERLDGYLFLAPGDAVSTLQQEMTAARQAGLDVTLLDVSFSMALDFGPSLRFPRQAQFHALKYLSGLGKAIQRAGGKLYQNSHVSEITDGSPCVVTTADGHSVTCQAVVVATNTPINDRVAIHTKQAAYRTYVIAAWVPKGSVPRGLFWDTADPYHYIRLQSMPAEDGVSEHDLLLVGGEDHKTGQAEDMESRYESLVAWTHKAFPMSRDIKFRWSGQIVEPFDGLAHIGKNPGNDHVYVATGDSGNGLTHGTIAGLLLSDLILGTSNPWAQLYDPSRKSTAIKEWARENLNAVAQYTDWITAGDIESVDHIPRGSGAVITRGLKKVATYRDDQGLLHECSAVCPHLNAIVHWNPGEKTWDCPAHGSRFDTSGQVMNGPANMNLEPVLEPAPVIPEVSGVGHRTFR